MAYVGFLFIIAMQAAAPQGAADDARQPYVIPMKDGTELVGFWEERGVQSGGVVRVELDEPWNPHQWKMIAVKDLAEKPVPERPSVTAQRLEEGWKNAGYVLVNGMPVLKEKFELAQRARTMAGLNSANEAQEPDPAETGAVPAGAVATEPGAAPPLPGFFEQWGGHIGLIVVAVLLLWLVVRMTFLAAD